MAAQLHSIKQTIENNGEDVVSALYQLNTLLEYYTREEVIKAAEIISVQLLFDFLTSSDEELVEVCCGVLGKIFKALEPREVCLYRDYIELGLQHPFERVRQTCLDTLASLIGDPNVQEMVTTSTVFHLVTQSVGDPSLKCANVTSSILFNLTKQKKCSDDALAVELRGIMQKDSVVRCRVYELAAKIAVTDDTHLASLTSILVGMVQELGGDDVLVQLNCIEMLILLMESSGGRQFLENHGVIAKLHILLSVDLAMMYIPGIAKGIECFSFHFHPTF